MTEIALTPIDEHDALKETAEIGLDPVPALTLTWA